MICAGSAAVPQPLINLTAVSTGANAALGRELCCPPFSYAANDLAGMVTAFLFEDVGVTAYNGAAPLISDKTFLSDAISIGLIEAYHAGIVSHQCCCYVFILPWTQIDEYVTCHVCCQSTWRNSTAQGHQRGNMCKGQRSTHQFTERF